jgi:acetyltransferase-like isoleucine patch superfamily enzyme
MNNGNRGNPIGRPQACTFFTGPGASIVIGNNVGMSSTALIAMSSIVVEDDVKFGGGVCVYDTDFHAQDPTLRRNPVTDRANAKSSPVVIQKGAFIGAHSTILKGVVIGSDSIVGACSVVTRSIPPGEIWAGNPARFIRKLPLTLEASPT